MKDFIENYCRICHQCFCCKKCRLKHEETIHKVHPECTICTEGRAFSRNLTNSLLEHFEAAHWPLHCVFCRMIFKTTDELQIHSKCEMAQAKTEEYDSPIVECNNSILSSSNKHFSNNLCITTSTPMHKDEFQLLKQIPEVITPVEYVDKIANIKSDTKSPRSDIKNVTGLQRRVTFSDIEIISIETPYISKNQSKLLKQETSDDQENYDSPNAYLTASDLKLNTPKTGILEPKNSYKNYIDTTASTVADETTWESALMDPDVDSPNLEKSSEICEDKVDLLDPFESVPECDISRITEEAYENISSVSQNLDASASFMQGSKVWSSMTNMFKCVVQGLTGPPVSLQSRKRVQREPDSSDNESPLRKRFKLTHIQCRKSIRNIRPFLALRYGKLVGMVDKGTQTD